MLASIPSPSSGEVHLGGVALHAYGVMLLLGILAAVWLTGLRWTRRGGDWDLVFRVDVEVEFRSRRAHDPGFGRNGPPVVPHLVDFSAPSGRS